MWLTLPVLIPDEEKKGLKDLHKTFWGTTKKCENKILSLFLLIKFSKMHGEGKIKKCISRKDYFASKSWMIWYPCVGVNSFLMIRNLVSIPRNAYKRVKQKFIGFGNACFVHTWNISKIAFDKMSLKFSLVYNYFQILTGLGSREHAWWKWFG